MEKKKTDKKKKIILIGLGVAATGLLSYFGWEYWKKRNSNKEEEESSPEIPPSKSAFLTDFFPKQGGNDDFPLKKGSRGPRVKALQESLMAKHGREILPRYGADGSFGNEMVAALKKLNMPQTIDESSYNVLVQGQTINPSEIAKRLYKDAANKNLNAVISSLKKMQNQEDYSAVSKEFQNYRISGVRHTLVNGILKSFSNENQKQQIRLEFTRMGLKYDGSKWSLSGLEGFSLITVEPTIVWKSPRQGAKVPGKMILGTEIASRGDYTLFENKGKKFIVKTSSIKYF